MRKAKTNVKKKKAAAPARSPQRQPRPHRPRRSSSSTPALAAHAPEPRPVEAAPAAVPVTVVSEPIAVSVPEAAFVGRVPPPDVPRPLPAMRRGIFFDVENSSRPEHVTAVLDHLAIDWTVRVIDLVAIGNWRVVSQETARLLAQRGAQLVHSAPSVGIRDWSDLRIAVAAGAWLASARPGDVVEIISDDQAFDAVGDVAATLGVRYHRLSYRAMAGLEPVEAPTAPAAPAHRPHRGRRGRRGPLSPSRPVAPARPAHPTAPPSIVEALIRPAPSPAVTVADPEAHTAPADEIKHVVEQLLDSSPGGVTLDAVGNALKARGFRRTSGSPRLITRLRRLKGLEVTPRGIVRMLGSSDHDTPASPEAPRVQEAEADLEPMVEATPSLAEIDAVEADADSSNGLSTMAPDPRSAERELPSDDELVEAGDDIGNRAPAPADPASRPGGVWRRRRRRGGRRWRGRGPGVNRMAAGPSREGG